MDLVTAENRLISMRSALEAAEDAAVDEGNRYRAKRLGILIEALNEEIEEINNAIVAGRSGQYKPLTSAIKESTRELNWAKNKVEKFISVAKQAEEVAAMTARLLVQIG